MRLKPATLPRDFYLTLFLVGIGTFGIHEFAHWLAGIVLGYDMVITPNRVYSKSSTTFVHKQIITFAGPLITYLQAAVGFFLVMNKRRLIGYAILYMAFFMRLFATVISVFNPNDEARMSQDLGLGTWTLPVIAVLFLFGLLFYASRRLKLTVRDQLSCYLIASIVVTFVVAVDAFFFT